MLYHTRYSAPGGRGGRMVLTGQRYVFQQGGPHHNMLTTVSSHDA
jgi:hypothetical protein